MIRRSLFLLAILSLLALSFAFAKGGDVGIMGLGEYNIVYPTGWYNTQLDYFTWTGSSTGIIINHCSYNLNDVMYSMSCSPGDVLFATSLNDGDYYISLYINYSMASKPTESYTVPVAESSFSIDTTPPTITDDYALDGIWTNSDQTVTLTAEDGSGSGIANITYCEGMGCTPDTLLYTNPLQYTVNQNTIVRYQARDNVNNPSIIGEYNVKLDKVKPTTTDNAPADWQTTDITVTLTATDDLSGVANTTYCVSQIPGCTPDSLGTTIPITQEGTSYINYYSTDNANNIETIKSATIKLDKTTPITTDDAPDGWQTTDITVTLTATDDISGIADTLYCADQTDTCTPSISGTSILFDAEGIYYLRYFSTDNAGNNETIKLATIKIDKAAPIVTLISPYDNQPIAFGQDVTFNFNVTEGNSYHCDLFLNGLEHPNFVNGSNLTLSSGKYIWNVSCTDLADKSTLSETRTFTLLSDLTFPPETEYPNLTLEPDISSVWFWVRNEFGMINWSQPLDLSRGANWADFINLSFNHAGVNSTAAPELNSAAVITLNNLTWTSPRILKDNGVCSDCSINSYASGILSFNINSFSFYETIETPKESFSSSGGSSCTTNWTCTEWSLCIGNMQTRTCTKAKEYCNAIAIKPEEKQSCIEQKSVNKTVEQAPSQEEAAQPEQQTRTGITGFVIAHPASTAATLIALLGLTSYFVVSRIRARNAKPDIKDEKKEGVTWISGKSTEKVKDI